MTISKRAFILISLIWEIRKLVGPFSKERPREEPNVTQLANSNSHNNHKIEDLMLSIVVLIIQ